MDGGCGCYYYVAANGPVYCPMDWTWLGWLVLVVDCGVVQRLLVARCFSFLSGLNDGKFFESCRRQGDVRLRFLILNERPTDFYLFSLNIWVSGKSVVLSLPGPDFVFGPGIDDVFCSSDFSRVLT